MDVIVYFGGGKIVLFRIGCDTKNASYSVFLFYFVVVVVKVM